MNDPLATLLRITERQRDAHHAALMQAQSHCNRALAQYEQLLAYQGEYQDRAPGRRGVAAPMELVRCHLGFAGRLDDAVSHQRQAMSQAESVVLHCRRQLQDSELKVASVRKLIERQQQGVLRQESRLEQRRSDEAALRRRTVHSSFGGLS